MPTPIHTKRYLEQFNSVTIPSATADIQTQRDEAEVSTSSDDEKQFIPGKGSATGNSGGPADYANGGGLETLYAAMEAGTIATRHMRPDGTAAVGATNPKFEDTAFLTGLTVSFDQGGAGSYSATFRYNDDIPARAEA